MRIGITRLGFRLLAQCSHNMDVARAEPAAGFHDGPDGTPTAAEQSLCRHKAKGTGMLFRLQAKIRCAAAHLAWSTGCCMNCCETHCAIMLCERAASCRWSTRAIAVPAKPIGFAAAAGCVPGAPVLVIRLRGHVPGRVVGRSRHHTGASAVAELGAALPLWGLCTCVWQHSSNRVEGWQHSRPLFAQHGAVANPSRVCDLLCLLS